MLSHANIAREQGNAPPPELQKPSDAQGHLYSEVQVYTATCGAKAPHPLLRRHMPQLDVLRGIAVLMVVFYHGFYDTQGVQPGLAANIFTQGTAVGWLGVNLFFCLSGFLITGNLLDSKDRPQYYSKFYIRRALRILPPLFLILVVLVLVREISTGGLLLSLGFLANYQQLIPSAKFYGPLWSLSVEEQFYLFWPILVLHVNRSRLFKIVVAICVLEPVLRWLTFTQQLNPDLIHRATFLIADNLALGALVAIFARSRFGTQRNSVRIALLALVATAVILACGLPFGVLHRTTVVGASLQEVPFELMFTSALLFSLSIPAQLF